jgi:hypothetical protein
MVKKRRRRRTTLGMWPVEHVPADFTARVMHLHEARSCAEAGAIIEDGKRVLRQLKKRGRLPSDAIMERWKRSLRTFKKTCKR